MRERLEVAEECLGKKPTTDEPSAASYLSAHSDDVVCFRPVSDSHVLKNAIEQAYRCGGSVGFSPNFPFTQCGISSKIGT
jgi:hypothetical protein